MLIENQPCAICSEMFTPMRTGANQLTRTCGKQRCRSQLQGQHPAYIASRRRAGAAGSRIRRADAVAKLVQRLGGEFGELTVREQEIAVAARYGA